MEAYYDSLQAASAIIWSYTYCRDWFESIASAYSVYDYLQRVPIRWNNVAKV